MRTHCGSSRVSVSVMLLDEIRMNFKLDYVSCPYCSYKKFDITVADILNTLDIHKTSKPLLKHQRDDQSDPHDS